ncbi:hypothetical protein PR202_gb17784 [Eleusine coracana subsp. coracana]|uniref:RING-type E3 ubiquitin transferase n=1 Tax=Eleusine coracana subsp. coracana TaxID=191504 RepID=A0AAV5F5M5_ELECO|nr:hypothetical protein PR202_gb17784 [Eleusine coracana subsp. coracana]
MLGLATGCCFLLAAGGVKEEQGNATSSSSSGSSGGDDGSKGSHHHTVVVVLVTLAAVVVLSALLLLLLRFLLLRQRRRRAQGDGEGGGRGGEEEEDSATLQRQLQQLFHLHDAGLDQDVIDALPVFVYRELVLGLGAEGGEAGSEFDCAVCLCEFAREDALRLLPLCGHAFHVACIDTWLLSNSTCPLCRCVLAADDAAAALLGKHHHHHHHHDEEEDAVIPVRLGKFKSMAATRAAGPTGPNGIVRREREDGETSSSSSSLDARRCYSMGSYQYVLAEASLQVSVHRRNGRAAAAAVRPGGAGANHAATAAEVGGGGEGKRIGAGSKGDSFSVSKIWQWPRNGKGKLPVLASDDSPSVNGRLPWQRRSPGDS